MREIARECLPRTPLSKSQLDSLYHRAPRTTRRLVLFESIQVNYGNPIPEGVKDRVLLCEPALDECVARIQSGVDNAVVPSSASRASYRTPSPAIFQTSHR